MRGLTISANVFGTTFYSLVGLHLSHVIVGLILLGIVFVLTLLGKIPKDHSEHVEMISWVLALRRRHLGRRVDACLLH